MIHQQPLFDDDAPPPPRARPAPKRRVPRPPPHQWAIERDASGQPVAMHLIGPTPAEEDAPRRKAPR